MVTVVVSKCLEIENLENLVCKESIDWKLLYWRQTLQ